MLHQRAERVLAVAAHHGARQLVLGAWGREVFRNDPREVAEAFHAHLEERHSYEMRYYATPLLDTHRHYLFRFHDEFVEAIAEGIWLDQADRSDPFASPISHPLAFFDRICRLLRAGGDIPRRGSPAQTRDGQMSQ